MHVQLDVLGGVAGDMFIAAVLDAHPEYAKGAFASIELLGLPTGLELSLTDHRDHALVGKRFHVVDRRSDGTSHSVGDGVHSHPHTHGDTVHSHSHGDTVHSHSHGDTVHSHSHGDANHEHDETSFRLIVERLREAALAPNVLDRSLSIFRLLAEAEARVHGVAVDAVSFHEVGAWDSIADIVGAAYLIEQLAIESWSLSSIPLGSGRVRTAHGPLPVPAPATAELLRGFTFIDDGIAGERVTPTGAAILGHLRDSVGPPASSLVRPMRLARTGTGFGARTLPGISNVTRVVTFDTELSEMVTDRIGVIQFEVDDQSPEDLSVGIDALRSHDGVLDVLQIPAFGKKGRLTTQIQILSREDSIREVINACLTETSTIGLRWHTSARTKLDRATKTIENGTRALAVKIAQRPNGALSAKVEIDALRGVEGGYVGRQVQRSAVEAAALGEETAWTNRK